MNLEFDGDLSVFEQEVLDSDVEPRVRLVFGGVFEHCNYAPRRF